MLLKLLEVAAGLEKVAELEVGVPFGFPETNAADAVTPVPFCTNTRHWSLSV